MSKIDDGVSAIDLRDYFAAKAMHGLLAAQVHGFNDRPAKGPFASMAYEMADAMLAARKSSEPEQQQSPGWIEWNGGECPVPKEAKFWIKFRDGHACDAGTGKGLIWHHEGTSADIIAYRIVSNGDQK